MRATTTVESKQTKNVGGKKILHLKFLNRNNIFVIQLNYSKPIPNERTVKNTSYIRIWTIFK